MSIARTCNIMGCENVHIARGYCSKHYQKFRDNGSLPLKITEPKPLCKNMGCERQAYAIGLCTYHRDVKWHKDNPLYGTWRQMKARCYSKTHKRYSDWGGRGIQVCERWRNSYKAFASDMGERPKGMSLDRIDNDGNYEPSNCKWSTIEEQNSNKRKYRIS